MNVRCQKCFEKSVLRFHAKFLEAFKPVIKGKKVLFCFSLIHVVVEAFFGVGRTKQAFFHNSLTF